MGLRCRERLTPGSRGSLGLASFPLWRGVSTPPTVSCCGTVPLTGLLAEVKVCFLSTISLACPSICFGLSLVRSRLVVLVYRSKGPNQSESGPPVPSCRPLRKGAEEAKWPNEGLRIGRISLRWSYCSGWVISFRPRKLHG